MDNNQLIGSSICCSDFGLNILVKIYAQTYRFWKCHLSSYKAVLVEWRHLVVGQICIDTNEHDFNINGNNTEVSQLITPKINTYLILAKTKLLHLYVCLKNKIIYKYLQQHYFIAPTIDKF